MRKSIAGFLRRLADDIDCSQVDITIHSTPISKAELEAFNDELVKRLRSKNPSARKRKTRKA